VRVSKRERAVEEDAGFAERSLYHIQWMMISQQPGPQAHCRTNPVHTREGGSAL
jgi:hypothetical protein